MREMAKGDIKTDSRKLRGWKVFLAQLVENELIIGFKGKKGTGDFDLCLKGLIKFQDRGIHGRPLLNYTITDRGSFRAINVYRANADLLLQCEYMEGEIKRGRD